MKTVATRYGPVACAALVLLMCLFPILQGSLAGNGGHLVYALDDAYVHMAMAKNLAGHGVFGVTQYGFSSSSSSPMWTLILAAGYRLFGVNDWLPGVLALLSALALLFTADVFLRRFGAGAIARFCVLCAVFYFTPLVPMVMTGMEHAMHAWLTMLTLLFAVVAIESGSRRSVLALCVAAMLATATRYETLFLIAPLAAVLLFRRRWLAGILLVVAVSLPVAVYGAVSMSHGGYLLPNSLMLKGQFHQIHGVGSILGAIGVDGLNHLSKTPHMLALAILLILSSRFLGEGSRKLRPFLFALPVAFVIHLQFAHAGWFYRYEAYLVASSVVLVAAGLLSGLRVESLRGVSSGKSVGIAVRLVVVLILLWPLHTRGQKSIEETIAATHNIYQQQWHEGHFLEACFPPGTRVAVNDLGAVCFYADIDVVDLWGLGTIEVARAKGAGTYNTAFIGNLLKGRGVEYVIAYPTWFTGDKSLPADIIAAGDWTIGKNIVCGGNTVTFYGTSPAAADLLGERLGEFSKSLPESMKYTPRQTNIAGQHQEGGEGR